LIHVIRRAEWKLEKVKNMNTTQLQTNPNTQPNNAITFTFKDARNPENVERNSKGMERMLRLLFRKAGLSGHFTVLLVNTNPDMLREKGVKVVSFDRNSLCLKIWAEYEPFITTVFSPLGAEQTYNKLVAVINEKRFISAQNLYRDDKPLQNGIVIPEVAEPAQRQDAEPKEQLPSTPELTTDETMETREIPNKFKGLKHNIEDKAFILDALRKKVGPDRISTAKQRAGVIKELYKMNHVKFGVLGTVTKVLKNEGYLETTEVLFSYRLSTLADMFLVRQGLLNESEAVTDLPPLPPIPETDSKPEHSERRGRKAEPKPAELAVAVGVGKLQAILAEMDSLVMAVGACEQALRELDERRQALDKETAEVKTRLENFQKSLSDPKYTKAKQVWDDLKAFE